jgi:hypothetical protein
LRYRRATISLNGRRNRGAAAALPSRRPCLPHLPGSRNRDAPTRGCETLALRSNSSVSTGLSYLWPRKARWGDPGAAIRLPRRRHGDAPTGRARLRGGGAPTRPARLRDGRTAAECWTVRPILVLGALFRLRQGMKVLLLGSVGRLLRWGRRVRVPLGLLLTCRVRNGRAAAPALRIGRAAVDGTVM